jgi:hypothetical protein
VELSCYLDHEYRSSRSFHIAVGADGRHHFSAPWAARARACDVTAVNHSRKQRSVAPVGPIELAAYTMSGAKGNDLTTVFDACTEVHPEDVHQRPPYEVSMEVAVTLVGALRLCPGHPYAGHWRAALQAGENRTPEGDVLVFGSGTYRVGPEIEPGTYFAIQGAAVAGSEPAATARWSRTAQQTPPDACW